MPEEKNGTWKAIRNIGAACALVAVIIGLLVTLLINPVNERACDARERAEKNAENIADINVRLTGVEKDVGSLDKNVERIMGAWGIPTVREVPAGELSIDPPEEKK